MATIINQILNADGAICKNIGLLAGQRDLLSQNVLSQLRNLVEGIVVFLNEGSADGEFHYDKVDPAITFVKSKGKLNFLARFHKLIQKSASHYTLDGDASERLMLKYYEYLYRVRNLLSSSYGVSTLDNLEAFPIDLDPSLKEYHEKIAERIESVRLSIPEKKASSRYYIHRVRPFFVNGGVYYEVTFYRAVDNVSKFDRIIAFTDIDLTDKYAALLTLKTDAIQVLQQMMPITIIRRWEVSIRPCEFNNFARLFGTSIKIERTSPEYRFLMSYLTNNSESLGSLLDMTDNWYQAMKDQALSGVSKPQIFQVLDIARQVVRSKLPGQNIIRYLMLQMNNQVIKSQHFREQCKLLSNLQLQYGCIPFDSMPFCSSPIGHNPRYWDVVECLDNSNRQHELLARRVRNNIESHGLLYTSIDELILFENIDTLIATYNRSLYYKHNDRQLIQDKGQVFIRGYEDDTVAIIEKLHQFADDGIDGYSQAVERWLNESNRGLDDDVKSNALKRLFIQSKVALIYGAAGTGKSTMVNYIANFFNDKTKLFLAHTNPAKDNLQRKVTAQNSTFRTINSQIYRNSDLVFDLVVIDECSTVSNADLLTVLEKTTFKLIVLVGDVYQIESIQFGNWFSLIRSFIPPTAIFELTTPYRAKNETLLTFWNKVRNIEDDIAEFMVKNGYSTVLDNSLFEAQGQDEIILCLNYDGLYGINNINRFLQGSNPHPAIIWRDTTYKIDDPVLFNDTGRFGAVIYNNLKGWIVNINTFEDRIQFDIQLDRPVSEFDVDGTELEWMGESTVRFSVFDLENSDDDDDEFNSIVPFQVAYAVSIHKAQGLEYDSVKIVITDSNEDQISHNIFYTAVTRARKSLKIFWTPETQQKVLQQLSRNNNSKDVHIISSRRNLTRVI
jgi:energy-coupling factor transporter ATP-binding protein EcfA2